MNEYLTWLDEKIIIAQQRIAMINNRLNSGEWYDLESHNIVSIRLETLVMAREKYEAVLRFQLADSDR